jgi:hypothetical protein
METYFSETSVDFQRTTLLYIAEDKLFHKHRYGNFKSYRLGHRVYFPVVVSIVDHLLKLVLGGRKMAGFEQHVIIAGK